MPRIHVQSEITAIRAQTAPGPERAAALRQFVRRVQLLAGEAADLSVYYRTAVQARPVQRLADKEGSR